ncbi:MAG: ABC transporter permease, partial [Planctomycetes bacterium]|nr:ABC transporter permease [Planctomycetota bacterium]
MSNSGPVAPAPPALTASAGADGALTLRAAGRLEAGTVGALWRRGNALLDEHRALRVVLDARAVTYCDAAGAAWIAHLRAEQKRRGGELAIEGLSGELERVVTLLVKIAEESAPPAARPRSTIPEDVGRGVVRVLARARAAVAFAGELAVALGSAVRRPHRLRWRELLRVVELAGSNAVLLVAMIGTLFGLILAFQAAIPLQRFGAELYIADLVALSMVRELAAILTAVVFAGRTGSAFAAELGTMKVNEELDALRTMGLDPTRFLVVPRVLAGVIVTPLLSLVMIVTGLAGAYIVLNSLGYGQAIFEYRVLQSVTF